MDETKHCPVCGNPKQESKRYPRYLCQGCALKMEDETGRPLRFTNVLSGDGILITYADTGVERISRECVVQGLPCFAREAYMGGVVVQPLSERGKIPAPVAPTPDQRKGSV